MRTTRQPIGDALTVPGDKSITHRALMLAALARQDDVPVHLLMPISCPRVGSDEFVRTLERLAGPGVAVAGDERDLRVEQGVDEAALAEVERLERLAVRDLEHVRDVEFHENTGSGETRGDRLFFAGAEQHVFVHAHARGALGVDRELAYTPESRTSRRYRLMFLRRLAVKASRKS